MIADKLFGSFRRVLNATYRNPDSWLVDFFHGGQESDSGVHVGPNSALKYAPYFQGINIISGDIGKITLPLYKTLPKGRERDRAHPSYRLMMYEMNDLMTADVGRQLLQSHALGWGNGRAIIVRNLQGDPEHVVPMLPDRTETRLIDGELWHLTRLGDSQEPKAYRDENVLHIKGLGFDGITGYSVATMARNSLGLGMATEKHGNRLFKNYAVPPLVLTTEQRITKKDSDQMLADWQAFHGGAENIGKTGLLHSGTKAQLLSMPSDDAQWLETRKLQRQEVASWLNLPPHKLGDDTRLSYNSIEQENLAYLNGCLLFWFVRWQQECRRKLLREREKERDSHYFEFFSDLLVSVDFGTKVEALNKLVAGTIISPNEAREKLNMNHREGGDSYENPNTNSREQEAKVVEPKPGPPGKDGAPGRGVKDVGVRDGLIYATMTDDSVQLVGTLPQGERGEHGKDGQDGQPGRDGIDGKDGRGIAGVGIVDGILSVTFTDEATVPLGNVIGPQGLPGTDGTPGRDGTDGEPGINGKDGIDGRGISSTRIEDGLLVVSYSDDSMQVLGSVIGPAGVDGTPGRDGRHGSDGRDGKDGEPGKPSLYGRALDVLSERISREVASVRKGTKAKNFTQWMERWYAGYCAALASDLRRLGADAALALEHCAESRRQLTELTERATLNTLEPETVLLTGTWPERAVALARRIAGGELPNMPLEIGTAVTTPHGLASITSVMDDWRYTVTLPDGTTHVIAEGDIEVIG